MKPDKIETIKRFMSGEYSRNDLKKLFLWFNSPQGYTQIGKLLDNKWEKFEVDNSIKIDSFKMLSRINDEIKMKKSSLIKNSIKKLLPYAAILIMALGFIVFQLTYNKTISVISDTNNSFATVMTENGQRSKIILPDSSIVWLNSGTTLSYNDNFSKQEREVVLSGQAYFQVKHRDNIPFIVECSGLNIKVLGTKFDVENYPGTGKISVVLESGKVNLTNPRVKSFDYTMKPGELAEYDLADNKINITNPDIIKYTSWKDGILIFKNDPIRLVFEKLGKWYNIEILVNDPEVYNSIFTGTIKHEGYEQIFRLIEYSCPVDCRVFNNSNTKTIPKIMIYKK